MLCSRTYHVNILFNFSSHHQSIATFLGKQKRPLLRQLLAISGRHLARVIALLDKTKFYIG